MFPHLNFILVYFFLLTTHVLTGPETSSTPRVVGMIDGTFEVDNYGNSVYKIPIKVPPGTASMTPKLTLTYNSSAPNGKYGVGWQLMGLSTITRCGSNIRTDGHKRGVVYDRQDQLCLDGQRLILLQGDPMADGALYHTQIESWKKVEAMGQSGGGPASFLVKTKSGHSMEYGMTEDSKVKVSDGETVRVWALNKVTDLNGNYMAINYTQEDGEYYPKEVLYTGNEKTGLASLRRVVFDFSNRTDTLTKYRSGHQVQTKKRLTKITTYVDGASPNSTVKCYHIDYVYSPITNRSVVKSVSEYASCEEQEIKIVEFEPDSSSMANRFNNASWLTPTPQHIRNGGDQNTYDNLIGDYNGDGIMDMATISPDGGGGWADWVQVNLSTGERFNNASWLTRTPGHMRNGGAERIYDNLTGDFNGDGLTDIATISPNGGGAWADWVQLNFSTGESFNDTSWLTQTPGHMRNGGAERIYDNLTGDFNGDGLTDIATISPNGGGAWAYWVQLNLSTGEGFNDTSWLTPTPGHMRNGGDQNIYENLVGDFNGDGLSDIATISPNGGGGWADWIQVNLSTGEGFRNAPWPTPTPGHMRNGGDQNTYENLVGDFNGDGLSDIATISPNGGGGWADWVQVNLSTGEGFRNASWPTQTPGHMRNGDGNRRYDTMVGDFNGDGLSDLATISPNGGGAWAYWVQLNLSTGEGFRDTAWTSPTPRHMRNGDGNRQYETLIGDYNGDGLFDLMTISPNGGGGWAYWVSMNLVNPGKPDLIREIKNSYEGKTVIAYKPLTDPTVYTKMNEATFPIVDFQNSSYVVSHHTYEDGKGHDYHHQHTYQGAKLDQHGFGFLGFYQKTTTDEQLGAAHSTFYNQDIPIRGTIKATQRSSLGDKNGDSENTLLRQSKYVHIYQEPYENFPIYQVLRTDKQVDYYEEGNYKYSIGKKYEFDQYSNRTKLIYLGYVDRDGRDQSPDDNVYTHQEYLNDETNWKLGYSRYKKVSTTDQSTTKEWQEGFGDLSLEQKDFDLTTMNVVTDQKWDDTNNLWLTTTYTYDEYGNKITKIGPEGNASGMPDSSYQYRTIYDGNYHTFPIEHIFPPNENGLRLRKKTTYDPKFGVITAQIDKNLNPTIFQLDGFGRVRAKLGVNLEQEIDTLLTRAWKTDGEGYYMEVRKFTDWEEKSFTRTKTYLDGLNRSYKVVTQIPGQNREVTEERKYLTPSIVAEVSLPAFTGDKQYWNKMTYDVLGRRTSLVSPFVALDGSTKLTETRWNYQNRDKIIRTDAFGTPEQYSKSTIFKYFNAKRKTVEMSTLGGESRTTYTYDVLGRLIASKDPMGNTNQIAYDALGRKKSHEEASLGQTNFYYNAQGRLDHQEDALDRKTTFTYDKLGRKLSKQTSDRSITYHYDIPEDETYTNTFGRLSSVKIQDDRENRATYFYGYDQRANLNKRTLSMDGQQYTSNSRHYPTGKKISHIYPDQTVLTREFTKGYLQRMNIQLANGTEYPVATYGNYNALGQATSLQYGNGVRNNFTFDPTGNMLSRVIEKNGDKFVSESFGRDHLLQITRIVDEKFTDEPSNFDHSAFYEYQQKRLVKATSSAYGELNYDYDLAGNTTLKGNNSYRYQGLQVVEGRDVGGDLIFSADYDTTGNMISKRQAMNLVNESSGELSPSSELTDWQYSYNAENQLVAVHKNNSAFESYFYDHRGRRLKRTTQDGRVFTYVSPHYVVSEEADGTESHTKYVFGTHSRMYSLTTTEETTGKIAFYHKNQVNNTTLITDETGNEVAKLLYRPYGALIGAISDEEITPKLNGKNLDNTTGLYYFGARYYDPQVSSFLTADPGLGAHRFQQDAYNRYAINLNDPINHYDPTGKMACSNAAAVGGIAFGAAFGYFAGDAVYQDIDKRSTAIGVGAGTALTSVGVGYSAALGFCNWSVARWNRFAPNNRVGPEEEPEPAEESGVEMSEVESSSSVSTSSSELGAPCSCFTAKTPIKSKTHTIPIEQIAVGDSVWAYNHISQKKELKPVVRVFKNTSDRIIELTIEQTVIEATPEHPFWVIDKGWTPAKALGLADKLLKWSGEQTAINRIQVKEERVNVYNFEVDDAHNYYVSNTGVLVHNQSCLNQSEEDSEASETESGIAENGATEGEGDMAGAAGDAEAMSSTEAIGAEAVETAAETAAATAAEAAEGAAVAAEVGEVALDICLVLCWF